MEKESHKDVCFICASHSPRYWAVGPCGHQYCGLCALRLRSLLRRTSCPMCKVEQPSVFVSQRSDAAFQTCTVRDEATGIHFESAGVKNAVSAWSAYSCPVSKCHTKVASKDELKHHLEQSHKKLVCPVCLQHKPVFPFEWTLFDNQLHLQRHLSSLHPSCTVCPSTPRFYTDDDLLEHCRHKHELCHICTRRGHAGCYFADYHALEKHFGDKHFLCRDPLCLELKFVVFETELEYKAHVGQVHLAGQKMQRSQARQLSRIDISINSGSNIDAGGRSRTFDRSQGPARSSGTNTNKSGVIERVERPKVDTSKFFFLMESASEHCESIHSLAERNVAFSEFLEKTVKLDKKGTDLLREECGKYHSGKVNGRSFVHWLSVNISPDDGNLLKQLVSRLSDICPDRLEQIELNNALKEHVMLQESFPALPQPSTSDDAFRPIGNLKGKEPIRGRILPRASPQVRPGSDPFRNPLALTGRLTSSPHQKDSQQANKKQERRKKAPSFTQATSGTTSSSTIAAPPNLGDTRPSQLPQDSFPALVGNLRITDQPNDDGGDDNAAVFVIGAQSAPASAPKQSSKRKGKQVLLHYGGFSNPLDNT